MCLRDQWVVITQARCPEPRRRQAGGASLRSVRAEPGAGPSPHHRGLGDAAAGAVAMAPAGGPRVWLLSALAAALILGAAELVLANEEVSCDNPSDPGPPGSYRDLGAGPQEDAGSDRSGSSSRIVNGSDCERDTQPWQGALLLGPGQLYCGAVLVAPQWLLTAAHCRKPVFRVRLGHHSMSPVYESGQQMFKGVKSIPHPGYSHPGHSNDLMLIKLNRKVRESRTVRAINISSCCPSAGTRCTVSGWGTTNNSQHAFPKVLQCLNITVLSEERCKEAYPGQIDHSMFCAGDEEGRDSCQGDSGGPVVCDGFLQGLVSWGDYPCAQPNRPGVYTNLCNFTKWIQDTIRSN